MNLAEASVSKSVSSMSMSTVNVGDITQAKGGFLDMIFPLYDQMMQKTKLPAWFLSMAAIIMLIQVLSIGFWIYAPPFERLSGKPKNIYHTIIKIFTFQDPNDYSNHHEVEMIITLVIALVSILWIVGMIVYYKYLYTIPTICLYISTIILDVIDPICITPAVYVICHGITGIIYTSNTSFIDEIIIGAITYGFYVIVFLLGTLLKSRSVVLTNLTFPLFDSTSIYTWVIGTSFCCIISAIMKLFDTWFYVVLGVVHLMMTLYVCYRLTFVPFYEVWRNSVCLSFGITTIALDLNFFVLYCIPSLTYNYTLAVFIGVLIISIIITTIFYKSRVNKITEQLAYQETELTAQEYLRTLNIDRNPLRAMMYIVVGLARLGNYFVDGSLTDYIINNGQVEEALSILLQVVTFFPSESRKMDILFKKLAQKKKKLGLPDRFLLYQVYGIKTRRLVSDTKDTLEMFNKLKQKNDECKAIIRGFWDKPICTNEFFSSLSMVVSDLDAYFRWAISNNPNNIRIANEYANFLCECLCDFDRAIVQSVKAEYISNGTNFNVDISFKSAVNKFPKYLKVGILDTKGKRVIKKHPSSGSVNQSETNSSSSGTGNSKNTFNSLSVDIEHQELISKRILRDSKVRLAFHHSIVDMKPRQSKLIAISAFIVLITMFVFFLGFYLYVNDAISWRKTSYNDIRTLSYVLFFNYYTNAISVLEWARRHNKYDDSGKYLGDITIDKKYANPVIPDKYTSNAYKLQYATNFSKTNLGILLNDMSKIALTNNVYKVGENLIKTTSTITVCDGGVPLYKVPASLKAQITLINFHQNQLSGKFNTNVDIPHIYVDNDYCQVMANSFTLSDNADQALRGIVNFNQNRGESYNKIFYTWMIAGLICLLFFLCVPALYCVKTYNDMVDKILKVLLQLPNNVKDDCKKPLMLDYENESTQVQAKEKTSKVMNYTAMFYFFLVFVSLLLYFFMTYQAVQLNKDMKTMMYWFYYSCVRVLAATETGNNVVHIVLLSGNDVVSKVITLEEIRDKAVKDLEYLLQYEKKLVDGTAYAKSILGFDEELDNVELKSSCQLGRDPVSVHDMYACSSISAIINIFKNMVEDVLNNHEKYKGIIKDEVSANIIHILQEHFYGKVITGTTRMRNLMEQTFDKEMKIISIPFIVGLILAIIMFGLPWIFRMFVNENYKLLLMMFQHISPQKIVESEEIMNFFRRTKKKETEKMSLSKSIVLESSECIIVTNANSIIEIVNQAVTDNLELTPDQMLGQTILSIVSDNDKEKLETQINLMMSGQGSSFWEDHLDLTDENSNSVPFTVTMIGMKDREDSDEITSIVFILANETEEIKKREAAEEAKAKSEKLLYQILPKDIVIRLNRGETDISFNIPSATIFFVDIVKFSAYASSLTPTEIMANLSLVFATFDRIVSQYESITKIKLIGDVYMAAAGLFQDPNDESVKHAEDSVRCCIEISKSLDEINMKLNASLEVRIGVNSGGPLIGGVLGTDKPTFDIIGDPINVAARLQSTDIPGNVQISQATKGMIENLEFEIEERGEIYLKGKGNQLTYFVSLPAKNDFEGSIALNISDVSK
ncbi:Adenylate and Guanylate cyclase catalytic domain containing protein [Trichomonas vaginalis G3]|uniref:Adenylate and Guanylate cyclase catalytic domain containing protein n=1 Tax=Trichomonas vaginalis (strain ATCC PRA-98 / G3) TaxID=412133 RepID=A2FD08_TRIV3|nr:guanylate cyclase protein [Trichomonas vaginalis G3]EAX97201.1 Adenylate and Guanylate cyclase catalytic domain containing protein [Trichomonas vaginalis G3]KAI5536190.1 guanylate cyclase protein [Trichomonas vaginalis G3]|eukprot:XP_001310131.1 Adenylate and Guanylate cyclase catalytic domain containing protein [Trichomonas vaginalis G3]